MLENSFQNFRVGYAAAEAVILLAIVLLLTAVQFGLLRTKEGR
jgi:multiple sugar transport system permease protein